MWGLAQCSKVALFIFAYLLSWFSFIFLLSLSCGLFCFSYSVVKKGWYRILLYFIEFSLNYFCNVFIALFEVSSSPVTSMIECIHFMKIKNG